MGWIRYRTRRDLDKILWRWCEEVERDCGSLSAQFAINDFYDYRHVRRLSECEVIQKFYGNLLQDDIVWDIGAHIGIWSCLLADALSEGQIIAFEPHPENSSKLRKSLDLNHLAEVSVEEIALSDRSGYVTLYTDEDPSAHSVVSECRNKSTTVQAARGEVIADALPSPTALKIDVEGAELAVLDGLGDLLEDCRLIMCEVHPMHGISLGEVIARLEGRGFSIDHQPHRNQPFVWAERPV